MSQKWFTPGEDPRSKLERLDVLVGILQEEVAVLKSEILHLKTKSL